MATLAFMRKTPFKNSKMCIRDRLTGVLTGVAGVDKGAHWQCACAVGGKGAVALQAVVAVNQPAVLVGGHRGAASHMGHHKVCLVVVKAMLFAESPAAGLVVEHMEAALARHLRQAGITCQGLKFIGTGAVHNVGTVLRCV